MRHVPSWDVRICPPGLRESKSMTFIRTSPDTRVKSLVLRSSPPPASGAPDRKRRVHQRSDENWLRSTRGSTWEKRGKERKRDGGRTGGRFKRDGRKREEKSGGPRWKCFLCIVWNVIMPPPPLVNPSSAARAVNIEITTLGGGLGTKVTFIEFLFSNFCCCQPAWLPLHRCPAPSTRKQTTHFHWVSSAVIRQTLLFVFSSFIFSPPKTPGSQKVPAFVFLPV